MSDDRPIAEGGGADPQGPSDVPFRPTRSERTRSFHDYFAQYLTALMLGLRALREQVAPDADLLKAVRSLESLASQMNDELYRVIDQLQRPQQELLDELDLLAAVWAKSSRVRVWRRIGPL